MKKLISLILILAVALSLCACGQEPAQPAAPAEPAPAPTEAPAAPVETEAPEVPGEPAKPGFEILYDEDQYILGLSHKAVILQTPIGDIPNLSCSFIAHKVLCRHH